MQIVHFQRQLRTIWKINSVATTESFLRLLTRKRAAPYASMYITPGGQCHMFTRMSPFLAFYRRQRPKGPAEGEQGKQSQ